jgi:putative selenium metabolism hydrolase
MNHLCSSISDIVEERREECVAFLRELIMTPSPSGEEAAVAEKVAERARASGFDMVKLDKLNDVMLAIKGSGGGRSLLLNGHIDHVPVGDMIDPYSGKLMDGARFGVAGEVVYGRAASDMKAAVAAMIMAGAFLRELDVELEGDFKVAAVAQEEVGGFGTMATIQDGHFLGDVVVVGEATNMDIYLGHRGSTKLSVVVRGKSCHASAPERGVNALYKASELITRIRDTLVPRLPDHPIFGKASVAVTDIRVKPGALNVVPEECEFFIDCRNHPDFPPGALKAEIEGIIESMREEDPELETLVLPMQIVRGRRDFPGFYTDPEANPIVQEARDAVSEALGRDPGLGLWRFSTDGRFYSWLGIPVLGFGPGEERFAHTHEDHVRVDDYLDAIKAYAWLACKTCGVKQ